MTTDKYFKLRKLTSNNKTGDAYGITLPKKVSNKFKGIHFQIKSEGDRIILESGCPTK